jgi:tRNA pseudouridine38-40 synthase
VRNIRLLIEYDGTAFAGWQVQPGLRTVQGVLEERLGTMTGERVTLIGSGRTDAGVHARGQTANFKTASAAPVRAFCQGLNGVLPRDIAILHAEEAAEEFHARYGARARVYRYSIIRRRSPILERYAWRFGHLIDETVMGP